MDNELHQFIQQRLRDGYVVILFGGNDEKDCIETIGKSFGRDFELVTRWIGDNSKAVGYHSNIGLVFVISTQLMIRQSFNDILTASLNNCVGAKDEIIIISSFKKNEL